MVHGNDCEICVSEIMVEIYRYCSRLNKYLSRKLKKKNNIINSSFNFFGFAFIKWLITYVFVNNL